MGFELKGFYEKVKYPYNDFEFMEKVIKDEKTFNLFQYLHGYCDLFAIKLKEMFPNYDLCILSSEESGLIHSYATFTSDDGTEYYIDARGITTDKEVFFTEYEDFFDWYGYFNDDESDACIDYYDTVESYLSDLKELLCENDDWYFQQEDILKDCEDIIHTFKDFYTI